jgi:hypothetical protein
MKENFTVEDIFFLIFELFVYFYKLLYFTVNLKNKTKLTLKFLNFFTKW